MTKHLIIGSGPAALSAVEAIRRVSQDDEIKVVSREDGLPYLPSALPYLLAGRTTEERLFPRGMAYFEKHRVTFVRGLEAERIVPEQRQVVYRSGQTDAYDRLLIACGAGPVGGEGALEFHTLADYRRLVSMLKPGVEVAVLGAGLVAVELAVALVERGVKVTIIGRGRPLRAYFDEKPGAYIAQALSGHGIDVKTGLAVTQVKEARGGYQIVCRDGQVIKASVVVSCMGVRPRLEVVQGSGIAVNQGILVDRRMRTNVEDVYAAGDVAEAPSFLDGRPGISAILPNAIGQGAVAGTNMAGGQCEHEGWLPMNLLTLDGKLIFSIGTAMPDGGELMEKSDEANRKFERLAFRDGRLVGAMFVNVDVDPGVFTCLIKKRLDVGKHRQALFERPRRVSRWLMMVGERGKL